MAPLLLARTQAGHRCSGAGRSTRCRALQAVRSRIHCHMVPGVYAPSGEAEASTGRRQLLLSTVGLLACAPLVPPAAHAEDAGGTFKDPVDGFQIAVPSDWAYGEGTIGSTNKYAGDTSTRRTVALFPNNANPRDVNVTIVVTNVSVEFTKLGSFGDPYTFGSNLVNSQDRSYLLRAPQWARGRDPIQVATLLDAREVNSSYYVEYTIEKEEEKKRHLYSLLSLGYNGRYNRMYTVTGQCLEEDLDKYKDVLLATLKSLATPAKQALA